MNWLVSTLVRFTLTALTYGGVIFGFLGLGISAQAHQDGWVSDRILLRFKVGVSQIETQNLLSAQGAKELRKVSQIELRVLSVAPERFTNVLSALKQNPAVEFAEPDFVFSPDFTPNDPLYGSQWHLPKINAPAAWDTTLGNPGVIIAILDTGIDATHPDLSAKLVPGWNTYDNNSNTADTYGHGTWVAGTAAASGNNGIGIASVAINCSIMPIRISDASGLGYASTIASGLTWAADHGARVANVSYEVTGVSSVSSAAQYFQSKGGVVTVSAGNESTPLTIPDDPTVLTVSATDSNDAIASFSNTGTPIDLAAPGVSVYTTDLNGQYASATGTSFSAPTVAGVAALVISVNPGLSASQIQQILKQSADDLGAPGWDPQYGWGRVNAQRAVAMAASYGQTPQGTNQIWGRVLWGGQPVSGAVVSSVVGTNVYQAWAGADGSYAISNLASSTTYTLTCAKSGLTFTAQFQNPIPLGSANAYGADFVADQPLLPVYNVSGRISDPVNGAAGAEIRGAGMVTTTDSSGNYQFTNFLNGTYSLIPRKDSWTFSPGSLSVTVNGANLAGNNFARTAPGSISGNIYGVPAGASSPAPVVFLSNGSSVAATRKGSGSSRYWGYTLNNVPAGEYGLSAELAGYSITGGFASPTPISAGMSSVNFTGSVASTTGSVNGRITQSGVPLPGVLVQALQGGTPAGSTSTDSDGYYRIPNLANATVSLSAGLAGYTFSPASLPAAPVPSGGNDFNAMGPTPLPSIVSVTANPAVVPNISSSCTLSASATATATATYSWDALQAAGPVAFSTNDTSASSTTTVLFRVPGSYVFRVRVADANGLTAASNVAVSVTAAPGPITLSPYQVVVNPGQTIAFRASAWDQAGDRTSISPAWTAGGGGVIDSTGNFSATSPGGPYLVSGTSGGLSGSAYVWVTGPAATVVPPTILTQPLSQTVDAGTNFSMNVTAGGSAPMTYQWLYNGAPIAGATNSGYTKPSAQSSDAGSYSVQVVNAAGTAVSATATLTVVVAPVITTQPLSQTVAVGSNAVFTVVATGTAPLTYQWLAGGTPIAGATTSTLTKTSAQTNDSGSYSVQVANAAGTTLSSSAVLWVISSPVITSQPLSQWVAVGSNVTFSVAASSSSAMSVQWLLNGSPIPGATNDNLSKPNVQSADSGSYSVAVSNAAGTTVSGIATLTVNSPPILNAIQDRTIHAGSTLVITNIATDPDLPAQTLTFSLGTPIPPGSSINASNGVFVWTPNTTQAGTSNVFIVTVTDGGVPSLSDSKNFIVNVLAPLNVASVSIVNSTVSLVWATIPGLNYSVEYMDNVVGGLWQPLGTSILANGNQTNATDRIQGGQRFYRIKLAN